MGGAPLPNPLPDILHLSMNKASDSTRPPASEPLLALEVFEVPSASRAHGVIWRLRNYLLAGSLVAAPMGITLYVTWAFISFVDESVKPLIPDAYNPETYFRFSFPGLGLLIMLVALTLLGALAANLFGQTLLDYGERIVARMPIVRGVYNASKQILETVATPSGTSFRQAALIEYPRKGLWTICFITGEAEGEVQARISEDVISIYVPTTPNPTSGFLLFVPRAEIRPLDMGVEEAVKMIISMGLVMPKWKAK